MGNALTVDTQKFLADYQTFLDKQTETALEVAEAWQRWIDDPDHNPAPSRRANTAKLRAYKAAHPRWTYNDTPAAPSPTIAVPRPTRADRARSALATLADERKADPEPNARDVLAHRIWAQREETRLTKQLNLQAELY